MQTSSTPISWKPYSMDSLFTIKGVGTVTVEQLINSHGEGDYPYITRTDKNNGISGFYNYKTAPANVLTIETTLSGLCFYHEYEFSTGDHIAVLMPKGFELNKYIGLFIKSVWRKNAYKYGYGRPATVQNIRKTEIILPTKDGSPAWKYMEDYMRSLEQKVSFTSIPTKRPLKLDFSTTGWKYFPINQLFRIEKGKRLTKEDMTEGDKPFIGAISVNNGIREFISNGTINQPNCITVNYNGSVGEAFYQTESFIASDDVNILYPVGGWKLNIYTAMFLCSVIKHNKTRFSYGRKWKTELMGKTELLLPIKDSKPDWNFMEEYIKNLPFAEYL